MSLGKTAGKRLLDGGSTILMKHPAAGGYLNAGGSAVGAYVYRGEVVEGGGNASGSPFHLTRAALQDQEGCNDSWTDEEGEEPIELYNYVLRRKCIGRLPIKRGRRTSTRTSSASSSTGLAAAAAAVVPVAVPSSPNSVYHQKHPSEVTISDDEENTSEYSHDPSSQRSTLESNPELPAVIKRHHRIKQQAMHKSTTSAKDTDDDEDDDDDDDDDEDEVEIDSSDSSSSDEDNERVGVRDEENGNKY